MSALGVGDCSLGWEWKKLSSVFNVAEERNSEGLKCVEWDSDGVLGTGGPNCGCEGPHGHLGPHPSIPETPVPCVWSPNTLAIEAASRFSPFLGHSLIHLIVRLSSKTGLLRKPHFSALPSRVALGQKAQVKLFALPMSEVVRFVSPTHEFASPSVSDPTP